MSYFLKTNSFKLAYIFPLLALNLFYSCSSEGDKYLGFWVDKSNEEKVLYITEQQENYLVDFYGDTRVPARLNEGMLDISIFNKTVSALIDENDVMVLSNAGKDNEYIRLDKSKNFQIVEFRDCVIQSIDNNGDDLKIIFTDLKPFPVKSKRLSNMDIQLCIQDASGTILSNPKYQGKKFVIRWKQDNSLQMKPLIKYLMEVE